MRKAGDAGVRQNFAGIIASGFNALKPRPPMGAGRLLGLGAGASATAQAGFTPR
jgi:hypothetical protein